MQNNPLSHARRICLWLVALLGLSLLTGCDEVKITNLTPGSLPENPSQIYTLTARFLPKASGFVPGSMRPSVVIDGKIHPMKASQLGQDIYEFDYQIPAGRTELAYYYLVNFKVEYSGAVSEREAYIGLQNARIVGRYVLSLEVNRGPVGARISVLGRGFTPQDVISFDSQPARTVYESPNSLSFFVPSVEPNRNYQVQVSGASGNSVVGTFRVDGTNLTVSPTSLNLRAGETQTLTFSIPNAAPTGGLLLDVTTDVPESVIMPEVVVPAGSTSVTIDVQGGKAGSGSLFLKGYGVGELSIPVTVQ